MCLLAVLHRAHPESPLIVAANRDEFLARPAAPLGVLRASAPRVLGGRDLLAGGTWLAVAENGLVAGLTNRPASGGRDASKRSRGELPLALALGPDAERAVAALVRDRDPADYNPAWLLVGDARTLHYVDFSGPGPARARALPPGLHVLENRPLDAPSPKADAVRRALAGAGSLRGEVLRERLWSVLRSHEIPPEAAAAAAEEPGRRPETQAACVHAGAYGTRSSAVVVARPGASPSLWLADGPPCESPVRDAAALWVA